jgi:hypothetical protein
LAPIDDANPDSARARESTPRGDEHDNEVRPADQRAHGHVDVYHRIDLVMGNRLGFYPRHVKTFCRDDEHRIGDYFRLIKSLISNALH